MDHPAPERNVRLPRVEALSLNFPQRPAVQGVTNHGLEAFQGKLRQPLAGFLIGGKDDFHRPVRYFRMGNKVFHSGHYLRHARLVVRSQQGSAVAVDNGLLSGQIRLLCRVQAQAVRKLNFFACVILNILGLNVFSGNIACRINVGKKPHRRRVFLSRTRRKPGYYIAMAGQRSILKTKRRKFVPQGFCQIPLPRA